MAGGQSPNGSGTRHRARWITAGVLALLVGLVVLWVQAPALYGRSVAAKRAATTTHGGILLLLGVALIAAAIAGAAVWVNHRTPAETQQANREAQKGNREALAETQRANREEDQRARYSAAIEQLGSDQRSVRLGAIYTLERLADYSEDDRRLVVEVMSAYVRDRHRQPAPTKKLDSPTGREHEEHHQASPKLPPDEQAALTVLGRLRWREGVPRPDLTGTDFAERDLVGVNLSGAHLDWANLPGAHLGWANLSGADLDWANLSGARLDGANFREARNLQQGQLDSAGGDAKTQLPEGLRRPAGWAEGDEQPAQRD